MNTFQKFIVSAVTVYKKKIWYIYLPLTALIIFLAVNKIIDPGHWETILSSFILGTHEAGHPLFSVFGRFMMFLGGTLLETLLPLLCIIYFWVNKRYYDAGFCLLWLAYVCFDVGIYMADAKLMALPLVTDLVSSKVEAHDWHNLFSMMGLLEQCVAIGKFVQTVGYLFIYSSLGLTVWLQFITILGALEKRQTIPLNRLEQ